MFHEPLKDRTRCREEFVVEAGDFDFGGDIFGLSLLLLLPFGRQNFGVVCLYDFFFFDFLTYFNGHDALLKFLANLDKPKLRDFLAQKAWRCQCVISRWGGFERLCRQFD